MEEKSKGYGTVLSSCGLIKFRVTPFGMVNSVSTYNHCNVLSPCVDVDGIEVDTLPVLQIWLMMSLRRKA